MRTREAAREAWKSEDDRGAVLFIMIFFLIIFIAVAALAVDLAAQGARGQDLQNASDAAALAGVAEYQAQFLAGADEAAAIAAAEVVARQVLLQNGIDPSLGHIEIDLSVTNAEQGSRLKVTITDTNPDQHLPNDILGQIIQSEDSALRRAATAEFLLCKADCALLVTIPPPFEAISARGNGDGYKPIEVGTRLYALNHNSGSRNIVCVDRATRQQCWPDSTFRPAYAGTYNDRNPEMPHTAVVNSTIYWTATDEGHGLRMYCYRAGVDFDFPCSDAITLDSSLYRYDEGDGDNILTNDKDENRGGGTFTVLGNKVFAFSDNHRIHCYNPATSNVCAGYGSTGNPTSLSVFPPNSPVEGNHGSSIDRIIDDQTGYVYSTLHIPYAQKGIDCSSDLPDPAGLRVVALNKETGRYLASDSPDSVYAADDGADARMWWDVENYGSDTVSFQSAAHGEFLDANTFASTSNGVSEDDRWNLVITPSNNSYFIDSDNLDFVAGGLVDDGGTIIEEDPPATLAAEWNFYPWECGVDPTQTDSTPDFFESGTWLHCYNTATIAGTPGPCPGFTVNGIGADAPGTPSPMHLDATRFSGRLWFYYAGAPGAAAPNKLGVCSSGYGTWYAPGASFKAQSDLEINCVDLATGTYDSSMSSDMGSVLTVIQTATSTRPNAWGDPHWNPSENRLFYPTEHTNGSDPNKPQIACYDFDDGPCDTIVGNWIEDEDGKKWTTQDYGFVSDGNCVYALGHTAFFWAFKASDVGEKCETQPTPTKVERCECGDGLQFKWGELDFSEVDMDLFDVFGVRIMTDAGPASVPIYPSNGLFHSIKPGGASMKISLDDLSTGFPPGAESVIVEIYVEGAGDGAIEDMGEFEIRFAQRPKLVD